MSLRKYYKLACNRPSQFQGSLTSSTYINRKLPAREKIQSHEVPLQTGVTGFAM
jgi:hypothetical protein